MNIEIKITELRKQKGWSKTDLAKKIEVSRVIIGRYERNEAAPSIEMASQIAEALEVSLDYLAGNTSLILDKGIVKRIQDIQLLDKENKNHLFALMDAFLRDYKAKQAYDT